MARHKVVIVGGGSARLTCRPTEATGPGQTDVAVIDPGVTHYYQPLWTLVGGGLDSAGRSGRRPAHEGGRPRGTARRSATTTCCRVRLLDEAHTADPGDQHDQGEPGHVVLQALRAPGALLAGHAPWPRLSPRRSGPIRTAPKHGARRARLRRSGPRKAVAQHSRWRGRQRGPRRWSPGWACWAGRDRQVTCRMGWGSCSSAGAFRGGRRGRNRDQPGPSGQRGWKPTRQ